MSIGNIRKVETSELDQFRDHLLRLDKPARRSRFAHSVSDSYIEKYAALPLEIETVIHGCFVDDVLRGVSELRPIGGAWGDMAEVAFSVEPELQGKGVATELMGRVIQSARNRCITFLTLTCLAENHKMQRIAKKFDAQLKFEYGEVTGQILPQKLPAGSVAGKLHGEEVRHLTTILDLDAPRSRAGGGGAAAGRTGKKVA